VPDALNPDDAPYLSIVCAFGHAQRAPRWLAQTRAFLASVAHEAERNALPVEIVLVDWNAHREAPAEALLAPLPYNPFLSVRVLTIPDAEIDAESGLDRERRAQNVGIRRSRGRFILACGTDIVPSHDLFAHLATRPLAERCAYYALRFDTWPSYLAGAVPPADGIEAACRSATSGGGLPPHPVAFDAARVSASDEAWRAQLRDISFVATLASFEKPFEFSLTNFLLMGREAWLELGGFPEWRVGDMFLDRMVMALVRFRAWEEQVLPAPCHYFSLARLRAPNIPGDFYVDAHGDTRIRVESPPIRNFSHGTLENVLIALNKTVMSTPGLFPSALKINDADWGLAGLAIREQAPAVAAPAGRGA